MKATKKDKLRMAILAALSMTTGPVLAQRVAGGADTTPNAGGSADAAASPDAAPAQTASNEPTLDTIVVTGVTSKRNLLNSSVDVSVATAAEIEQKAPRSTADVLQLIPGIFVESTAGPVSNNYSVRGLPGGGQNFIMLQEDGMPVLYGGGGSGC